MRSSRIGPTACRTPDCAASATATPTWRRIFRWPLFCVLAAVHLAVLPLVLGGGDDRLIAVLGGLGYLVLAALDRRSRRSPVSA